MESIAHFQRAREIMLAVGHREGVAIVTSNVGLALRENGRFDEALRCFDEALATVGSKGGVMPAMLIGNAGLTLIEAGRLDVAVAPLLEAQPGATIDQLIEAAEAALYRAKHNGRNRVEQALT